MSQNLPVVSFLEAMIYIYVFGIFNMMQFYIFMLL